tara:strand:- start:434 stop:649 length:216 start_codon:yes stop_codon:yes gene_type:complete
MYLENLRQKALRWCFKNDFVIYPVTKNNKDYNIVIEKGLKKVFIEDVYTKTTIHQGITDIYLKLYKKHNTK